MGWKPVALFLADLGVTKTHSRPYVSDDNPYSESQFKTLKYQGPRGQVFIRGVVKYRPGFPDRFGSIHDARAFCQQFIPWYNNDHHHSGTGMLTPEMVHYGLAGKVIEQRQQVLNLAYARTPERFVRDCPRPQPQPTAVWINPPVIEPANVEIRL